MNPIMEKDNELMHYGMPRRSGRYPWGSGEDPYQHSRDLLGRYEELKKAGKKESEIAAELGYFGDKGEPSATKLRAGIANARDDRYIYNLYTAKRLKEKEGMGPTEIGRKMGVSESTVRGWFDAEKEAKALKAEGTAEFIEKRIKESGMIDIGKGVERELGISKEMMNQALLMLEEQGYPIYKGGIPQATNPGQQSNQKVICMPGTPHKAIYEYDKVHPLNEDNYTSRDGGETFVKFQYPKSMDSNRLMIRYAEDGGTDKDGIVELRRGVDDLSLGNSKYSQVRILVDDTKYIKGMAVYSDDMPDGVDVIFNTNKTKDISKLNVLKDIKDDPDNPFGSLIKAGGQSTYIDKDGKEQLSLINKRADEGDWSDWQNAIPSQFLGKQSQPLAKKQLDLAKADKLAQYDEICSLNNPTIKKHLLQEFADNCDAAAVHLKAAALPGQKYHVIIPVNTLKDTEIYAPNYENGTQLALVRYPHGGIFEIPILTVNNKHVPAKNLIGTDSIDAVGINKKIADQLSGADFDGDTVMCIPTHDAGGKVKIKNKDPLDDLKGFDPKMEYPERPGMQYMGKQYTQNQMGVISNLITDMTLAGASDEELARAVKHSMVVIDAHKHKLDYKKSEIDNNIEALKREYQPKFDENGNVIGGGGAATILSRAKGEAQVERRQGTPRVNLKGKDWYDPTRPEGALLYKEAEDNVKVVRTTDKKTGLVTITTSDGSKIKYNPQDDASREEYQPVKKVDPTAGAISYTNKSGTITYKTTRRTQPSTNMAETDDARTLVSAAGHPMELLYADYANSMKALANKARKEMMTTKDIQYNAQAKAIYSEEVASLNYKLNNSLMNAPKEREANRRVNAEVAAKTKAYKEKYGSEMTNSEVKKLKQQAISKARYDVGAVSRRERNILITDKEWEAIQAGAISKKKLTDILNNADIDKLKERAMPRSNGSSLSTAQINRIKRMSASNFTLTEIAQKMGISTSTVSNYLKGGK